MDNISGIFSIDLKGQKREMKMTFGVIERLERHLLNRQIVVLLHEAAINRAYLTDVAMVFHECLVANKDTRLSLQQVGEAIHEQGFHTFLPVYVELLVYALYGSKGVNTEAISAEDKKK